MVAARYFIIIGAVLTMLCATVCVTPDGCCDPSDDAPQLEFTYSDGTTVFVKLTDTTIATSTVVTEEGILHEYPPRGNRFSV